MSLPPTPSVVLRLGPGAATGPIFELGSAVNGILGTNVLGTDQAQYIDISNQVTNISTRRGKDRIFDQYSSGECFVRFIDPDGDWNPHSGPYASEIKPLQQIQISADYNGTTYPVFIGYISSWDWAFDVSNNLAYVTLQAQDGFRLLALSNIENVPGAANKDLPGERINLILDEIQWASQLRNIETGDTELENDPGDLRTALQACQQVEISDLGAFFMAPDGKATFLSRNGMRTKAVGTATKFADDGTGIEYQNLILNKDDQELANVVTFTRIGGSPQTVSDAASISEYFTRTYTRSDLVVETNALAAERAASVLNYRKNARDRVEALTINLNTGTARIEAGLGLDIGDPITTIKTFPDGSQCIESLIIQGVAHDITPDTWDTSFTTLHPLSMPFVLGSNEFGILGTSTL